MKEFDYKLDYKKLDFTNKETRKQYRIGRGEQGVLLVRPYTNDICKYWRFKTPTIAYKSANQIYFTYAQYRAKNDFIGMDMCRKFLEMGFTRARRYVKPQEPDAMTCHFAKSANIFREFRNRVAKDDKYIRMRKNWRELEEA